MPTAASSMTIYRLSVVPTVADYARGLSILSDRVSETQRHLFRTHYACVNRMVTASALAERAGIKGGHPPVNSAYGRLGHLFCDAIGFEPDVRPDGTFRWWAVWSQGWESPEGFVWEMLPQVAAALELLGWVSMNGEPFAEQVNSVERFVEGSVCRVTVNAYERNSIARRRCIEHYGATCVVCGFDFAAKYGMAAEGYIHVHHLRPISQIGTAYEVDPIADLRPVCSNCHSVIHLGGGLRSIEEMQRLVANAPSA